MSSNLAVERALILLRYIVDNPDGLSIREASRNLGYSPAIVQKLINALSAQNYVVKVAYQQCGPNTRPAVLAAVTS
jgi:DNA-binding IclR family transcriptional regulator